MRTAHRILQHPLILALLVITTHVFAAMALSGIWSYDMKAWLRVADVMRMGANPYAHTGHLNWPPIWPSIILIVDHISNWTHIRLEYCIQAFLTGVDVLNVLLLRKLVLRHAPFSRWLTPLLFGLALSPIPILQAVQHCNFDALVGTWMTLLVGALWRHVVDRGERHWLYACFFLGLGVLTKTVPLILLPLILIIPQRANAGSLVRGAALALAPVTMGLLPLLLMDHGSIIDKVITYRGYAGWYGITGLLGLIGPGTLQHLYSTISPMLMLLGVVAIALRTRHMGGGDPVRILRAVLLSLLCITLLGPGYAPQYIGWSLQLLVLLFIVGSSGERRVLGAFYAILVPTYLVEYALIPSHGAFLARMTDDPLLDRWSISLVVPGVQTLLRLPLFLCSITVFVVLWHNLRATSQAPTSSSVPPISSLPS